MKYPKIKSVAVIDERTLIIEFYNKQKKTYNITPLLDKEMFKPLKNLVFFNNVKVEQGGYAIVWNNKIDISEYELWKNGESLIVPGREQI